ncbi:MAG: RNA polymerase sigma factor [Bacteroidetes bacterium]|nr:RNA polymerase sigma factor [Bacteroidota bacterium]
MEQTNFNQIVTEHSTPLKRFAVKLTQDTEEAQDLVQDTMLKAMTNAEKFQEGTNLKGWLFTIMKNIFINKYRRAMKSKIFNDDTDNQFYINSASISTGNVGEGSLVMKDITQAVGQLSDNLRTPFMLSYTGYKYEEIAEQLQIPLGTVKVRIHNARKELMGKLSTYGAGRRK